MEADLHLHTCFSDGTYTPEELVGQARAARLAVIALTDHDTVEGCPATAAACLASGLRFVPGTELTAEIAGTELHLLGYALDPEHPALLAALHRFQEVRQNRIREMVARLQHLGVKIEADAVFALARCRSPGRPHVGRTLVACGACTSVDEAFDRFLRRDRPAWVPKFKMAAEDAIRLVHEAGGLAVLAHPGINRIDPFIPTLVEQGLDGLECYHTKHSPSTTAYYLDIARAHQILVTGGSDCHGMAKGKPLIGSVRLPSEHLQAFLQRLDQRPPAVAAH